jgi:hypothetical protein
MEGLYSGLTRYRWPVRPRRVSRRPAAGTTASVWLLAPSTRPKQLAHYRRAQRDLNTMTDTAAFVRNDRMDILSAKQLGYALYSLMFSG